MPATPGATNYSDYSLVIPVFRNEGSIPELLDALSQLDAELGEVQALIGELEGILASRERRMEILKEEMTHLEKKYGDARRTEIVSDLAARTLVRITEGGGFEVGALPGSEP